MTTQKVSKWGGILNCLFCLLSLTLGHEPLVASDHIVHAELIVAMCDCGMDGIEQGAGFMSPLF